MLFVSIRVEQICSGGMVWLLVCCICSVTWCIWSRRRRWLGPFTGCLSIGVCFTLRRDICRCLFLVLRLSLLQLYFFSVIQLSSNPDTNSAYFLLRPFCCSFSLSCLVRSIFAHQVHNVAALTIPTIHCSFICVFKAAPHQCNPARLFSRKRAILSQTTCAVGLSRASDLDDWYVSLEVSNDLHLARHGPI